MPCAAGELCLIPNVTLEPPDGYVCGGGCGGRLHEQCGNNVEEVESIDDGSSETVRICTSCASKKPAAGSSSSSAGKRKATGSTIPFSELSSYFGPLENFAESSGNVEAGNFLRKAKMSFLSAYVSKPARQADIREFSEM